MTTDLLEERLQNLAADGPDAGRVSARVLSASPTRVRPVWPRVGLSLVATILLIGLVLYLVPAVDIAADKVPFEQDLLRFAGLSSVEDRIIPVNSASVSSGYRFELVGAYADATRTVLLMRSDPPAMPFIGLEMTDQFGRTYQFQAGTLDARNGEATMQFEPLAWPDQFTDARVAVQFRTIQTFGRDYSIGPDVQGSWSLQATISVDETKSLSLPADGTLGPAHFHFTSLTYSAATIAVGMQVTGASPEDLSRNIPDGRGKAFPALTVDVIDPSGNLITGSGSGSSGAGGLQVETLAFRSGAAGGDYVLRVSYYGYGSFDRVIRIP